MPISEGHAYYSEMKPAISDNRETLVLKPYKCLVFYVDGKGTKAIASTGPLSTVTGNQIVTMGIMWSLYQHAGGGE
jgi:hypothetical protein